MTLAEKGKGWYVRRRPDEVPNSFTQPPHLKNKTHGLRRGLHSFAVNASIAFYAAAVSFPALCSTPERACTTTGVPNIAREKNISLVAVPRKNGMPAA